MKILKSILLLILLVTFVFAYNIFYRDAAPDETDIVNAGKGKVTLAFNDNAVGENIEKTIADSLGSKELKRKDLLADDVKPVKKKFPGKLTPEMVKLIEPGKAYQFDSLGNLKEIDPEIWDGVSELDPKKRYKIPLDLFDKYVEADLKRHPTSVVFWDSVKAFKKKMREEVEKKREQP